MTHAFIFQLGQWSGEGLLSFSMADDQIPFKTRWRIEEEKNGIIAFSQTLEVDGYTDHMKNVFKIWDVREGHFLIELSNELIGTVQGKGVVNESVIAWEFKSKGQPFEGFEIYEKKEEGVYQFKAEFTSGNNLHTFVQGMISAIDTL